MFVRLKKIKAKDYGYLVSNEWTSKGPRQKTHGYLGRAFDLGRIDEAQLSLPSDVDSMEYKEIITWMIRHNLEVAGFSEEEGVMKKEDLVYNPNLHQTTYRGRKACFKLNEGVMCQHTLDNLLSFERTGENRRDIVLMAEAVVTAGLKLTKDVFVKLFSKLPAPEMEEQSLDKFEY